MFSPGPSYCTALNASDGDILCISNISEAKYRQLPYKYTRARGSGDNDKYQSVGFTLLKHSFDVPVK